MKFPKSYIVVAIAALGLAFLATGCSVNISTAHIKSAKMAVDKEGTQETAVFANNQTFYCIVQLANAPDDTNLKAVWTAVTAEGAAPNTKIDEAQKTSGDGTIVFNMTNNQPWPVGSYKVDLFLNEKLDRTLEFQVK
jgi:hypothetical protein